VVGELPQRVRQCQRETNDLWLILNREEEPAKNR